MKLERRKVKKKKKKEIKEGSDSFIELDFYQTIVLINYIRHQSSLSTCFSCGTNLESLSNLPEHLKEKNCIASLNKEAEFWKDPKYLMPTYENDPLLTGFEDSEDSENEGQ